MEFLESISNFVQTHIYVSAGIIAIVIINMALFFKSLLDIR